MTDWYSRPQGDRTWLCGDGTVLDEPVLEHSGSNRRVRVFGRQSTALNMSDRNTVIRRNLQERARRRGTYLWMPTAVDYFMYDHGCNPDDGSPGLFLLEPPVGTLGKSKEDTALYWTFRHPTLPISAQVVIEGSSSSSQRHAIDAHLSAPVCEPDNFGQQWVTVSDAEFSSMKTGILDQTCRDKFTKMVENDLPDYMVESDLGERSFKSRRQAAKHMLDSVRWADALDALHIPDLRAGEDNWLVLELVETNFDGQMVSDLTEYLTNGPTIEKALEHYEAFQGVLRSLGVVLPKVDENQIQRLMLAGEDAAVRLQVTSNMVDLDGERDHKHTLHVHLTTGTLAIKCDATPANQEEVAQAWGEAQAIASITGRETELLAFAREFAKTNDETKARQLVRRRKAGLVTPH